MLPLHDSVKTARFPFWVVLIILINAIVFLLEITSPNLDQFINTYALIPARVNLSELSTLFPFITSQFLHGGWLHILSNMWFLWVFGDNVEEKFGFLGFPIIYLLSGIVGGLAQYLIEPNSTIPMIGASGAVAGVLGAYFALFPNHTIKTLVPIVGFFSIVNLPAFFVLIYWFITQIFAGSFSFIQSTQTDGGGVAYFAHVGGFALGWLAAKIFNAQPKSSYLES